MLEDAYSSVINYAQIPPNCPNSLASYSADSYSACFPKLRMPSQLWDMNPAWTNCNIFYEGVTDPPSVPLLPTPIPIAPIEVTLVPTDALVPSPTKMSDPSLSAAPASAPLPSLAPVTSLPINSLPSPASMAQQVHESAEPTASHRIGDPKIPPQVDPPSQTKIDSSSIQGQPRDSTQPPLGAGSQSGRDQPSLRLHNEGDPATGNQHQRAPVLTLAGFTYTADTASHFVIAGQTLAPGSSINPFGTPVFLASDGIVAAVGSNLVEQTLVTSISVQLTGQLIIADATYTADSASQFIIAGQTLSRGAINVSNTRISLAIGGATAIVGTSTQALVPIPQVLMLTFGGSLYTADASSAFTIDGQALTTGGVITVDGTLLSLDIEGTAAIVGSSTQMLDTATITGSNAATIHLGAQTYTEDSAGEFIISGQTLAKGGEITVSGTPVSFEAGGTGVVIGSSTKAVGVGGWVMSGLSPGAASTGVVHFKGKGLKREMNLRRVLGVIIIVEFYILMH